MGRYAKAGVAVAAALFASIASYYTDDQITNEEWVLVATAFVSSLGVFFVRNKP